MLGRLCNSNGNGLQQQQQQQRQWRPRLVAAAAAGGKGFAASRTAAVQRRKQQQQQQRQKRRQRVEQQPAAADDDDEGEGEVEGELSHARHVITLPDFAPALCTELRQVFHDRFSDPRRTMQERFLWDYWFVRNQYTLHRTQAAAYFPEPLHAQLVDALLDYGERQLGCRAISPIWLSYYVDGCCQELHCDSFHGPFAFVLSLTPWEQRPFTGGETMLLQPGLLGGFWQSFQPGRGLELTDLVTLVEPHFGQLTLFDPRLPHGVRPVAGTRDPLQGRLVLHGWFTEPSPFFDGPLDEAAATACLNSLLEAMMTELQALPGCLGTLALQFRVSGATGAVSDVGFLADTLVALPAAAADMGLGEGLLQPSLIRGAVQHTVRQHLLAAQFPVCAEGDTVITLPLVFE